MLVTIDIGNTHCCLGIFNRQQLVKEFRVATNRHATSDEMGLVLSGLFRDINDQVNWEGVVISSVVPELDTVMEKAAEAVFNVPVLTIKPDMKLPIKNHYHSPQNVGADRLMGAVAAVEELGAPVIVVDFGTATTVDVIDAKKRYLGGAIMPGLVLSAEALAGGTSLLPRIELKTPSSSHGQDTEDSIRTGVILGAAGAVDYLVKTMRKTVGRQAKVIATGGLAEMVKPYCTTIKIVKPSLTLDGLRLTWIDYQRGGRRKRAGMRK